jgi:hypothetical protein
VASWALVPALDQLRREFNELAPGRDKASDGSVGDLAHQNRASDHNPDDNGWVHAIDVDRDLRTPGLTMEDVVQFLLLRCRAGAEKRLRYVIFNRRIWTASNGWRQEKYAGPNPHDHHAHFSALRDAQRRTSTTTWHLEELDMAALTEAETRKIVREELAAFGKVEPLSAIAVRTDFLTNRWTPAVNAVLTKLGADLAALDADVDEDALAAKLAAAIPESMAAKVADELRDRLTA